MIPSFPEASAVRPAAPVALLEGPAYGPDGCVYFSDIVGDRLLCHRPGGTTRVVRSPAGRPNGNVFDREGRLITCEGGEYGPGGGRRIVRTDLATGTLTPLTDRYQDRRYNSPNDVCVDDAGRIFFTDPRYGDRDDLELDVEGVYRIDLDGTVTRILGQPELERPNGLAVSVDGRMLYVVDSNHSPGGRRCLWAFDLHVDGTPSRQRLLHDFAPGRGGDGMEVDSTGRLFVCAGIRAPRSDGETELYPPAVYVFSPDGRLEGAIPIPADLLTNCCFGDPDLRTLYVTAGAALYSASLTVPGHHAFKL